MSEGFFVNTSRLTGCFNLVSLLENRLDLFRIQDCLAVLGGESVAWSQIIKIQKGFPPHGTSRMGNVVIVISFTIDPLWRCVFFLCLKIYPFWELTIDPVPKGGDLGCTGLPGSPSYMDVTQCHSDSSWPAIGPLAGWSTRIYPAYMCLACKLKDRSSLISLFPVQKSGYPDDMENLLLV